MSSFMEQQELLFHFPVENRSGTHVVFVSLQGDGRRAVWGHCSQGVLQWGWCQVAQPCQHTHRHKTHTAEHCSHRTSLSTTGANFVCFTYGRLRGTLQLPSLWGTSWSYLYRWLMTSSLPYKSHTAFLTVPALCRNMASPEKAWKRGMLFCFLGISVVQLWCCCVVYEINSGEKRLVTCHPARKQPDTHEVSWGTCVMYAVVKSCSPFDHTPSSPPVIYLSAFCFFLCASALSHCIQQILESVHHCHVNGIVHRDLKVCTTTDTAETHCVRHEGDN